MVVMKYSSSSEIKNNSIIYKENRASATIKEIHEELSGTIKKNRVDKIYDAHFLEDCTEKISILLSKRIQITDLRYVL